MPAQHLRRGDVPLPLRLEHEQRPRDDEAGAPDHLGKPEGAVLRGRAVEAMGDGWECGEAGDPEDAGADHLGEACEEADFFEVVGA